MWYIHGYRVGKRFKPAYNSWRAMKQRCTNPRHDSFKNYGGRGITFDERWKQFEVFINDLGDPPNDGFAYDLDRIDSNGNYCLDNCQWVVREVNRTVRK